MFMVLTAASRSFLLAVHWTINSLPLKTKAKGEAFAITLGLVF
jgi:hypothetical protein